MDQSPTLKEALHSWSNLYINKSMSGFMHFMRQHNLSFSQISVLTRLHQHGPAEIVSISREMQISKAGAGQLIARMCQLGWVIREPSTTDKRVRIVALTQEGKLLVRNSILAREEWISNISTTLPEAYHQEIIQALHCLVTHCQNHPPR